MAYESATNPTTGEKLFLVGDKWVPPSETATNPKTGQRAFLVNNEWQVLGTPKAAPTAAPAATEQPTNIISPEEQAGAVAPPTSIVPTVAAQPRPPSELAMGSEFGKGTKAGVIGLKSAAAGVNLLKEANFVGSAIQNLDVYKQIDEGKITSLADAEGLGLPKDQVRMYLAAKTPEAREQMKQNQQGIIDKRQGFIRDGLNLFKQYQADAEKVKGVTPDATDIGTAKDFGNWLAFNVGSGAVQLAPIILAAVTTGGTGAFALGTAMGVGETVSNRLEFIQNKVKGLPPEQQADEIEKYIRNTSDTTMAVGLASGALDLFGPVGSVLRARAGKEGVKYLTKKEGLKAGVKEAPRAIAEEGVTGGAQEAVQIGGKRVLGEQTGDVFSEENIKAVLNAAAAEAAGGLGGTTITTAAKVAQGQAAQNQARAEEARAKQEQILTKLNEPGAMEALGQQFNDTVDKLKASINPDTQKPYTEQEAYDAAGDAILQGGLLDGTESTIGGTDKSGVSVSGKPSETDTRTVDTTGGDLGAAGTITTAVGGGEGTELSTLTAEIKAKYPQMTDAQATAAATESLRQKQIATGQQAATGAPTPPAGSVTSTLPSREEIKSGPIFAGIPQKLIDLQNKMDEADAKAEGYNAGSLKRNATMAFRRYSDATTEYLKPYLTGDKDADQTLWMRFTDLLSEKAREIKETPAGTTVTTVTRGKSPGRPKTDRTPEQLAAAAEYRRQRQAIGRNASAEVDKVEKVLNRVVDEQAIIDNSGTEKEAQDTLYELRQGRIDALSVAYGLSVDSDQKNKTAGKRAAALLDKADPQERELGKLRHEAKQRLGAPSRSEIIESTNGQDNAAFEKFNFAKGAINYIAKNGNPFEKALAKRLAPFLNGVKFVIVDSAADMPTPRLQSFMDGAAGLFDPETKTIYVMREGGINNTVVLHEALHAATIAKINIYISLKNAKKPIPNDLRVAVAELYETMDEAKKLYDQLNDAGMLLPEMEAIPYVAFTDVKEFVAYGLSLPVMQDFLLLAPGEYAGEAPGFVSKLFNKFVQSLRKMFNMDEKHKSALQDLMIVTNKLLDISITPEQEAAAMGGPSQAKAKKQPAPPKAPKPPKQPKMVETLLRKIRLSNRSSELNGSIGELIMQVRNANDAIRLVKAIYSAIDVNRLKLVMNVFTTDGITRIAGDKINNLKVINDAVNDMAGMRVQMIRELAEKTPAWINFNQKYEEGGRILADLISASTLLEVDPTKYPDAATALKNDPKLQQIENDILNPPIDPKTNKPKSIASLKGDRTKRINAIKVIYEGGAYNNPITGEKSTMGGWEQLGKFGKGEGHAIYKMAKDSYKKTFDMHEQLLKEKIELSNVPGNVNDASTPKGKLIAAITKTFQEAKLLEVYFPLMRYGNFWFSVGKGKSGEFYMFEGEVARNNAIEARVAELNRAGDKRTKDKMIADGDLDVGNDIRKLREKHIESSDMLKELFAMLDQNKLSDIDAVKDNIYQMYLMTLPDKDIRRKFVHRQGKTGFSADAIRNFITSQHTAANQLARLKYSDKIRNGIAAAYAEIQQNPDKLKLAAIIREMSNRAINEITPTVPEEGLDWDQVASIGNKFVFYWLLTSPKSALVQMTQLPIVGLPTLGAEFGIGKATVTAARYGALWNKFGTTKKDENGDVVTAWGQPSINDSKYVNEHPNPAYRKVLKDAWNFANDKDIFMSTYAGDMTAMSAVPSARYKNIVSRGVRFTFDLMGGAFHHAERISREIMFMSAFELAYADAKQKGMDDKAAFDAATKRALKLTYDALFNYTQYNKPPIMKSAGGRLAFQFLTYPLQMTSYLVRNFLTMVRVLPTLEERKEAAIKFFGTLGMTGLFAGVTGFPLYSFIMGMTDGIRELMRDEDDEDYDEDDEGNPLGRRSTDLWFRNWFIPNYFGPDSSLANFFNLTEEQAQTLSRGVEMGPISAYTDLNVGTSTSLDGLWFRSDAPAETSREAFMNFAYSFTGPIGSVGANFAGAFDDFEKGQFNRGLEKLSPAWLKGGLTAMRLKEEGATTTKGDEIMNPEFYTTGKLLAQTLGFGSTEVAQVQKANFMAKKIVTQINREKQNILNRLDAAVRQDNDDKIDKILEEIDKFNTKNGMLAINGETVSKSLQARSERRGKSYQGLSVSDKEAPFVYPLVEGTRSPQYK
jgi:hypothetical protein